MSAVAEILQPSEEMQFSSLLKHAPVGLALCQRPGNETSKSLVFDELLGMPSSQIPCALAELIRDGAGSRQLISELFQGKRESFQIESAAWGAESKSLRWTVWAVHEDSRPDSAVVMLDVRGSLRRCSGQAAIAAGGAARDGRPFGGRSHARFQQCVDRSFVVLRSADVCGRGRICSSEPPSAVAEPGPSPAIQVAHTFCNLIQRNLLVRLIGENIELKLKLDSGLGLARPFRPGPEICGRERNGEWLLKNSFAEK
jgi:hypothetical protein